jgi:hypothetical protein
MNNETDQFEKNLSAALKQLAPGKIVVPSERNEETLFAIRHQFQKGKTQKKNKVIRISPFRKWLPLAASIVIAGLILYFSKPFPTEDIADRNGDGKVDILDALVLANQIKTQPPDKGDLNGDGAIDEQDVRAIAIRSVRLEEGDRS